ncbi:Achaete-scute complex protein T5 [Eumeta japonica]|uniref:Achaete-scute complex protein T5 n=1 Tax=Eumeta variegata TaxID=151549 RepID=A0A4C1SAX6_EUMVA|nr:Achaete-scute complex protein T5 [Eumeta japonica]
MRFPVVSFKKVARVARVPGAPGRRPAFARAASPLPHERSAPATARRCIRTHASPPRRSEATMLQEIQLVQGQTNYVVVASGYPVTKTPEKRNVAIAPAPEKNYVTHDTPPSLQYRKKVHFRTNPYTGPQAASIARRNARERNRVKQVNDGFNALRRHLPASVVAALSGGARRGSGKKLSKVDTLRMVVEYIRYLQQLLEESDAALGITRDQENRENIPDTSNSQVVVTSDVDDGFFYGSSSPCSEKASSPSPSECSSGVSSSYSAVERYELAPQTLGPMDEEELLDVISWWQQK